MIVDNRATAATLRDYVHVVRRRRWIILQALVVVPLAAVAFSLHQQKLYEAHAQVLLSTQNLAAQLTGTQSTGINLQPDRIAATQASVARVPTIAEHVLARITGTGYAVPAFLAASGVSTAPNADLLTFAVRHRDALTARRLVDAYALEYTRYRRQLDTAAIRNGLRSVRARIAALRQEGTDVHSALLASLVDRQATLATMEALQTSNATVVEQADAAAQVQPKPVRNGILGLVLGLVLGIGLAFLREALDTRVRTAQEVGERLGSLPLLARLPAPPRKLRSRNRLAMLEEPRGVQAEAFRMLRTNLEFSRLGRSVQTIVTTSAVEQEGKSTSVANLAVAAARAGQHVVLVDLDLRKPLVATLFGIAGPGLTQVALGQASLDESLVRIDLQAPDAGTLHVLASGPIPPDPGEFVSTAAVAQILSSLRDRADLVLIDAPPALRVGDAMTLSARADAMLVVARLGIVRRQMLADLARQLATVPAPVLGFIATGGGGEEDVEYGYGAYSHAYGPSFAEARR